MRVINSAALPSGAGSKFQLVRPVPFNDYELCERIRVEVQIPVRNPTGSTATATQAEIVALFGAIFSSWMMAFGDSAREVVDNALGFARLRELAVAMTQRDCYVSTTGGVQNAAGQITSYSGSNQFQLVAAATGVITLELERNFTIERLGSKQMQFAPGASQMRQLDLSFLRGAAWTSATGLVENGAASVTVIFDTQRSKTKDRWARVPRLALTSQAGLSQIGPDDGGALLSAWEYSAAASATALTNFSLFADGAAIHDNVSTARVTRDEYERLPLGAQDLNSLATVLFDMQSSITLDDLLMAKKLEFRQAALDLNPPQIAWLHIPAVTATYRDDIAGKNVVGTGQGQVPEAKLTNEPQLRGDQTSLQASSVAPMAVLGREHPAFMNVPGRLFQNGQVPRTHVPDTVSESIKQIAASHGTGENDVFARAVAQVSTAIPASGTPKRGDTSETTLAVASHVAPDAMKTRGDFLTGITARLSQIS